MTVTKQDVTVTTPHIVMTLTMDEAFTVQVALDHYSVGGNEVVLRDEVTAIRDALRQARINS